MIRKPRIVLSILAVGLALLLSGLDAQAATYYVATDGSDSSNGSIDSPWASIGHAARNSGPGDTVMVRGGTYSRGAEINGSQGAPGQLWTLQAYPGEEAIFTSGITVSADYVRIQGLHMVGPGGRLAISDWAGYGKHDEIIDNYITGAFTNYSGVIDVWGSDALVEGNTLNLTHSGTQTHGIYLMAGKDTDGNGGILEHNNTIVRNNTIINPSQYGIHIYDNRKKTGDPVRLFSNLLIEGNYVATSGSRSGIIIQTGSYTEISGITIRNNVLANNPNGGIRIRDVGVGIDNLKIYNNTIYGGDYGIEITPDDVTNVDVTNNIITNVGRDIYDWSKSSSITVENNVFTDPMFVNASQNDFHLQSGSPAIDSGLSASGLVTDIDGNPRPMDGDSDGAAEYDIGAYEYNGEYIPQEDVVAPAAPVGLVILN